MNRDCFKNCVFLGNFFSTEMISKYSKHSALSMGNDNYEKNFLLILKRVFKNIVIFCEPALPRFSLKFPFFIIKGGNKKINEQEVSFVPFLNGRIINTKKHSMKEKLFSYLEKNDVSYVFISTYHYTWIIKPLKKSFPDIKIVMLLPDLPTIQISSKSIFNNYYLKRTSVLFKKSIHLVDYLLPITIHQIDAIPNYKNKFFVYETFFDASLFDSFVSNKEKILLYAGSLNESYGIMNLIEAFSNTIRTDYKLIICGRGDCEDKIRKIANNNSNIEYLGFLNKKDVYNLEQKSKLIICPDNNERPFSFHSRFLEYLSSGTPILTYKPKGAKKEYLNFFNFVEDYSNNLTIAIDMMLDDNNYANALEKARLAKKFMLEKKNVESFAREISTLLY